MGILILFKLIILELGDVTQPSAFLLFLEQSEHWPALGLWRHWREPGAITASVPQARATFLWLAESWPHTGDQCLIPLTLTLALSGDRGAPCPRLY